MESGPPQQEEIVAAEPVRPRSPAVLRAVLITSSLGLLISILRWKLVSIVTLFIEPMIEFAIFGAFFAVFVWALIFAFVPLRVFTRRRFTPLGVALAALLIFVFVPFTELMLKADFYFNLSKRTTAVERVLRTSGLADTNTSGIGDRVSLPGLSDGDEGFYWHSGRKQMVLFLTFRGILGHFSGFVYSATDALPEDEDFGCRLVDSEHLRRNWYWIACR